MFQLLGQLGQPENEIQVILQTLFSFAFIIYLFYAQRIQAMTMLRQIEVTLRKIKGLRDDGKEASIKTIKEIGKPEKDPTPMVERFMERRHEWAPEARYRLAEQIAARLRRHEPGAWAGRGPEEGLEQVWRMTRP